MCRKAGPRHVPGAHILFERQLRARVPLDHPVITRLVSHCAMLKTLQVQGKDGRTAQQRARGNTGLQKRLNFGEEVCRYKARAEEGVIDQSTWRWSTGIWLGIERRTERFVLLDGTKGGIWHPRILLMPEIEKMACRCHQVRQCHPSANARSNRARSRSTRKARGRYRPQRQNGSR